MLQAVRIKKSVMLLGCGIYTLGRKSICLKITSYALYE